MHYRAVSRSYISLWCVRACMCISAKAAVASGTLPVIQGRQAGQCVGAAVRCSPTKEAECVKADGASEQHVAAPPSRACGQQTGRHRGRIRGQGWRRALVAEAGDGQDRGTESHSIDTFQERSSQGNGDGRYQGGGRHGGLQGDLANDQTPLPCIYI